MTDRNPRPADPHDSDISADPNPILGPTTAGQPEPRVAWVNGGAKPVPGSDGVPPYKDLRKEQISQDVAPTPKDGVWPDLPKPALDPKAAEPPAAGAPPRGKGPTKERWRPPGRRLRDLGVIGAAVGIVAGILLLRPGAGGVLPGADAPAGSAGAPAPAGAVPAVVVSSIVAREVGALSWGDPHLITHDGLHFDFQAAGEFVALRAAAGDMEIQVRQEAAGPEALVTTNAAVAIRIGEARIGFYGLRTTRIILRVDGAEIEPPIEALELAGGGRLGRDGAGWRADWPDGSAAWVQADGTLRVVLAAERAGSVVGLLGNANGNADDDATAADGTGPPTGTLDAAFVYGPFADGWRVTSRTSLFDYGPGEGPEAFVDRRIPRRHPTVDGLDEAARAAAARICIDAGVTAQPFLDACMLDAALGGDAALVAASVAVAEIAGRAGSPREPASASPTPGSSSASPAPGPAAIPGQPRVIVDAEDVVHVIWRETVIGDREVVIARRRTADGAFTPNAVLVSGIDVTSDLHVSRIGGRPCLSFVGHGADLQGGLWLSCRGPGEWSPPTLAVSQTGNATYVGAFDGSGEVHVLRHDRPAPISLDGVTLSTGGTVLDATLGIDRDDRRHVFWYELGRSGGLYHRVSGAAGSAWSDAARLDADHAASQGLPQVATDDEGGMHATWRSGTELVARSWRPSGGWSSAGGGRLPAGPVAIVAIEGRPVVFLGTADGIARYTEAPGGSWSGADLVATSPGVKELDAALDGAGQVQLVWATDETVPVIRHLEVGG